MNKKIKWGCIQPLTGGMYLGAENAIGHPADWIISYPGLTDIKKTKTGAISNVGNEYNLLMYLKNTIDCLNIKCSIKNHLLIMM